MVRRKTEDVQRGDDIDGIASVAEQRHVVVELHARAQRSDLCFQRTLTDGDEAHVGPRVDHDTSRGEKVGICLVGPQIGHRPDDDVRIVEPELRPHRCATGRGCVEVGKFDPVPDNFGVRVQAVRHGVAYRTRYRDVYVVHLRRVPVDERSQLRVAVPYVVLGRDEHWAPFCRNCPNNQASAD